MLKVSVVIPTLNRADLLACTIDRIENQTITKDQFEVLVIDNDSTDHTLSVLNQKSKVYRNLRVFSQPTRGAASTRNVGIRNAKGETILFIDDDIHAEPNLIESHLDYHRQNQRASIIGSVITPWHDRRDPFLRYLRDRGIFNPYSIASGPMDFSYYHTGNVSTSRALLLETGGFNDGFHVYGMEDIELGYRLEKIRCRMVYGPQAKGVHQYFPSYAQFIQRCEQAGYSLGKLLELHPELRGRFVEHGKRTGVLRRFHLLYQILSVAIRPGAKFLTRWEEKRGTGPVTPLLDQHYYWAVRYHFFLGYRQYTRSAETGQLEILPKHSGQGIPEFAIERRSKVRSGSLVHRASND